MIKQIIQANTIIKIGNERFSDRNGTKERKEKRGAIFERKLKKEIRKEKRFKREKKFEIKKKNVLKSMTKNYETDCNETNCKGAPPP